VVSEDVELSSQEDEEDSYADYYGNDEDVLGQLGPEEATDATFQQNPEHYLFSCLSEEEAWNYLDMQVKATARDIKEDAPMVRGLLHHLHWDQMKVKRRMCEGRGQLLVEAHLRPGTTDDVTAVQPVSCPVCLAPLHHSLSMECGHVFCYNCWREYLKERISAGNVTAIECMQCSVHVSLEMVRALLSSEPCLSKYHTFALAEFVQSHHLLRWCPGVNCSIVFQVKENLPKRVTCSTCTTSCCFQCGEPYHLPADCECHRKWLVKCRDDSETSNYILANTKDCPKCHSSIEKNGGCNHMHCSRCNHDFCWVCLEKWDSHKGYYECSRYKGTDEKDKNHARQALKRYLFYYERWANHNQSLKLEESTQQKILSRIDDKVAASSGTWIDWQYLIDAVDQLRKVCSLVLMAGTDH
jgi:ariadne-2